MAIAFAAGVLGANPVGVVVAAVGSGVAIGAYALGKWLMTGDVQSSTSGKGVATMGVGGSRKISLVAACRRAEQLVALSELSADTRRAFEGLVKAAAKLAETDAGRKLEAAMEELRMAAVKEVTTWTTFKAAVRVLWETARSIDDTPSTSASVFFALLGLLVLSLAGSAVPEATVLSWTARILTWLGGCAAASGFAHVDVAVSTALSKTALSGRAIPRLEDLSELNQLAPSGGGADSLR